MRMFNKNLNTILSGFDKVIKDLDSFLYKTSEDVLKTQDKIDILSRENIERVKDADKAVEIRQNLSALLGE